MKPEIDPKTTTPAMAAGSAAANMAALFDFCGGASHVVAAPVLSSPASFVVAFGHGVQLPLLAVST